MATFTSSLATGGAPVKADHAGNQGFRVKTAVSAATLSDIILLGKIPNGAIVTNVQGVIGTSNTDSVIKLGWKGKNNTGAGSETAFGTHTASSTDAVTNFTLTGEDIGGVHISFTDSIGSDYAVLYATCSVGSFTDTFSLDIAVTYHLDHQEGQGS